MGVGIEPIDGDEKEQRSETRSKRWSRGESCCSPPDGLEKERCDAVHLPDPFNCCRDWLRGPLIPIGSSAPPDPNLAIRNFEKSFTWRGTPHRSDCRLPPRLRLRLCQSTSYFLPPDESHRVPLNPPNAVARYPALQRPVRLRWRTVVPAFPECLRPPLHSRTAGRVFIEHPWSSVGYLGLRPQGSTQEEDLPHEEAPSADGRQGSEGCQEPQHMLGMWSG